ncbi:MAG: 6-carboxytetrahydropterin synthase QueD [Gammaproteobacteria bacterium]
MGAIYNLKIVTDFASAHTLRGYPGACSRMHGHNWKVEVEVIATTLDDMGMGVDFKVIKTEAKAIADRLDHRYLNDLEPFDTVNPTAENIAAHFHSELSQRLNRDGLRVEAVTLWETERACVRYSENFSS